MPDVAYGDGTVTRRRDGRLQVTVTVAGKRRYAMIPAGLDPREQRKRAEKARRELVDQREADVDPHGQTVAGFLRSWIEGLRDATHRRVRPRTLDHYAMIVERHIIPALGDHRIDRLSERHVQRWLDADKGSARTIHHHRAVLRRALNVAMRQRLVTRNVAVPIELPDPSGDHGRPLTADEAVRLLEATRGDRLNALWHLALATGLRQGELLGLGWDDLDGDQLTVRAQLQRRDGEWVRAATKAARSLQQLTLDPTTVAVLDEHRRRLAAGRGADWPYFGLMFVTSKGLPYHARLVLSEFHKALATAGIPTRRFHDLRVTNATLMREQGVPEDMRMARLGHSTVDMARHYAKARPGTDRMAAAAIETALRRAE